MIHLRYKNMTDGGVLYPRSDLYPINITTFSDRVSNATSNNTVTYEYVGNITIVYLARDKTYNILTDQGVLFNATLVYYDYG